MTSTMASTLALSRPSEKLGTHSISAIKVPVVSSQKTFDRIRYPDTSLEPGIAKAKLHCGVDAGIVIAHAGIRNMGDVNGHVHRMPVGGKQINSKCAARK